MTNTNLIITILPEDFDSSGDITSQYCMPNDCPLVRAVRRQLRINNPQKEIVNCVINSLYIGKQSYKANWDYIKCVDVWVGGDPVDVLCEHEVDTDKQPDYFPGA